MADLSKGRNTIFRTSILFCLPSQIGRALDPNMAAILLLRCLTCFFGAPTVATEPPICTTGLVSGRQLPKSVTAPDRKHSLAMEFLIGSHHSWCCVFRHVPVPLFLGTISYLTDCYGKYCASALAANAVLCSLFGVPSILTADV